MPCQVPHEATALRFGALAVVSCVVALPFDAQELRYSRNPSVRGGGSIVRCAPTGRSATDRVVQYARGLRVGRPGGIRLSAVAEDVQFCIVRTAFLGQMLGVQRATVPVAAQRLHTLGPIGYVRGQVTVTDRAGLEAAACGRCDRCDRIAADHALAFA